MSVFLVACDLVKEETAEDYEPLWYDLKRLDAHKTQLSLWLVNVNNTARELVDHLKGSSIATTAFGQRGFIDANTISSTRWAVPTNGLRTILPAHKSGRTPEGHPFNVILDAESACYPSKDFDAKQSHAVFPYHIECGMGIPHQARMASAISM
jgi:hypothetical protein